MTIPVVMVAACHRGARQPASPAEILGRFADDYGNAFELSAQRFDQLPSGRFHIVEWNPRERFFIARNDAANPRDGGLYTRVDWMTFTGMAPYTWGFCLTAYRAPTEREARQTAAPNRDSPRTGCNGFPFSRMQPAGAVPRR